MSENDISAFQKYSLQLKGKTSSKRFLEIEEELSGIYPYKIKKENILIKKKAGKGLYDVYISKKKIESERNILKILFVSSGLVTLCIGLLLFVLHLFSIREIKNKEQREFEKQEIERRKIEEENERYLELLIKEYTERQAMAYEKVYPCLERIYSVMPVDSTIENIEIGRNVFTVEVTTKDGLNILENFEKSNSFSGVKMNRSNVNNKKETVIYNGFFSSSLNEDTVYLLPNDKIRSYEEKLSLMRFREKKMKEKFLSEYIREIRELLRNSGCQEQYIQLKGKNNAVEVEFFILSSSKSILDFLRSVQSEEDNLIDIGQLRIRNSEDKDRLQTTVTFVSGIEVEKNKIVLEELKETKIAVSELDRIFYKERKSSYVSSSVNKVEGNPVVGKTAKKESVDIVRKLSFIGLTRSEGFTYVMAKDTEMGSIYKLRVCVAELENNCCIQTVDGYKAKIRDEYYEVKK